MEVGSCGFMFFLDPNPDPRKNKILDPGSDPDSDQRKAKILDPDPDLTTS
jgi:hypothetical protein